MKIIRLLQFVLFIASCWVSGAAIAQTPIHQCKDSDGGVVYSQLPCKDAEPVEDEIPADSDVTEKPEPKSETGSEIETETETETVSEASRAACKKRHRDEIDAIDAEIRSEYSPEKDGEYKQRLLALTRKLRAC